MSEARNVKASPLSPRLLSSEHAARYLGMARPTLYETGIRYVMVGRNRRYDVRDLDAWVEEQHALRAQTPRRPAA